MKKFLKKFWKENKKGYLWTCFIFSLGAIVIYDLMFLSMTNQPHPSFMNYLFYFPAMYGVIGVSALGLGIFLGGGEED